MCRLKMMKLVPDGDAPTNTQTHLRAADNDANERVFVSARSLHGGIKASGEIQLRVLGTPDYKTRKGSRCRDSNRRDFSQPEQS